jgi:arginine utilization regulatory protein
MENDNNITRASRALKIKRQTLQHKIKKYNIKI